MANDQANYSDAANHSKHMARIVVKYLPNLRDLVYTRAWFYLLAALAICFQFWVCCSQEG